MNRKKIQYTGQFKNFKRAVALTQDKSVALKSSTIEARVDAWQAACDVAESVAPLLDSRPIYCNKTGLFVFSLPIETLAQLHDNPHAERTLDAWCDNFCHPAWLNTAPESLQHLQLTAPAAYSVYCYFTMRRVAKNALARHDLLAHIESTYTAEQIIELAELLRRALALFGNLPKTAELDLQFFTREPAESLAILREAIAEWIVAIQRAHHSQEADRYRTVTLGDARMISLDTGSLLFQSARVANTPDDLALLADISEIFETTPNRGLRAQVSFKKTKVSAELRYLGGLFNISFDDAARNPADPRTQSAETMRASGATIVTAPVQFSAASLFGGAK